MVGRSEDEALVMRQTTPAPLAPKDGKPLPKEWGPYDERHKRAVIRIQARFRGYLTRKKIRKMYRAEVFTASDDTAPMCPADVGLGQYAEVHLGMPFVQDQKRYEIRDKTAKQVLIQLGLPARDVTGHSFDFKRLANQILSQAASAPAKIPYGIKKQMKWIHYFKEEDVATKKQGTYLIGQFDCVAIPCRADYNAHFHEIR